MIDKADCLLAMYGDEGVHPIFRRGVFGLCQQLSEHAAEEKRKYYEKFKHFRETIHGVLFVRNVTSLKRCYGDLILDLDLEYFLVGNNNLSDQNKFNDICIELQEILKSWTEKKAD